MLQRSGLKNLDRGCERARGEGGEFVQERKPADVLAVMKPLERYMTCEIAEERRWPWRTAYEISNRFTDDGETRKKKAEARRMIWILP
ncbi:hypothetical protein BG842_06165 [Haladaptatus sp. W1]|nr:hypothetical protein BG842_06165 [Haladaptatus sp. W1]